MAGLIDDYDPAPPINPEAADLRLPSLGDVWSASRVLTRDDRSDADQLRVRRTWEPIIDALGLNSRDDPSRYFDMPEGRGNVRGLSSFDRDRRGLTRAEQETALLGLVRDRRRADPNFLKGIPDDHAGFRAYMKNEAKARRAGARDVLGRSEGFVAGATEFAGGAFEMQLDPFNMLALPIGGGGKTLLQIAGREALANGAIEALQIPFVAAGREAVDEELTAGEAIANIGTAAIGGAVLSVGGELAARGIRAGVARADPFERRLARAIASAEPQDAALLGKAVRDGVFADIDDGTLARFSADLIGEEMSPTERAAAHVLTRQAEIDAASPFVPGMEGDAAHGATLGAHIQALLDDMPPPEGIIAPQATPVLTGQFTGIDGAVARIIGHESGGNANARNPEPGQTASGLGQFTDATWLGLAAQNPQLFPAGATREKILALKTDPAIGRAMTRIAVEGYAEAFEKAGLPVSDGNLYLAHFLGPQKAMEVLRAAPDTPMADLVPPSWIKVNKRLLEGKTAGELIGDMDRRMGGDGAPAPLRAELFDDPAQLIEAEAMLAGRVIAPEPDAPPITAPALPAPIEIPEPPAPIVSRGQARRARTFKGPNDLLTQIAIWGGLRDDMGVLPELREGHSLRDAMGLAGRMTKAGPLIRRAGMTIDDLGEKLHEAGWFARAERPSVDEVLDLIDRAGRGRDKIWHPNDAAGQAATARVHDEELSYRLNTAAERWGIEIDNDFEAAAAAYVDRAASPDEAIELALRDQFDDAMAAFADETGAPDYDIDSIRLASPEEARDWIDPLGPEGRFADDPGNAGGDAGTRGDGGDGPPAGTGDAGARGEAGAEYSRVTDDENWQADPRPLDEPSLKQFDDPAGDAARIQADSLDHDARMLLPEQADPAIADRQRQQAALKAASPLRNQSEQDGTMGLALFDKADQPEFRLSEEGESGRAISDIFEEIDRDVKAIEAMKGCMKPGGAPE